MATAAIQAAKTISIHALREESDRTAIGVLKVIVRFQSTLSVRRATCYCYDVVTTVLKFQSTLSVRRATFSIFLKKTIDS